MVGEKALGEAHSGKDVILGMQSRARLCMVGSSGRLGRCETVAGTSKVLSNSSTATIGFWTRVRLVFVVLIVERGVR